MLRNLQNRVDLPAVVSSLTAEAAILEERIRTLREELAAVSAHTSVVADALRSAERATVCCAGEADPGERARKRAVPAAGGSHGRGGPTACRR
ncbi:hypothetical protein B9W62_04245 [Streptomyces sp. CS113]|uniref:hypothetical protein n=1 Tax=Streptomyces sp. CS113 TaxID=1982761 RepID=UPI000B421E88|nr:hypothetical protein [Streptomyces sp. CS113]OWA13906.1 hypothetical protein B9W62_04245 [Streptomyces sp. CS113]